MYSISTDAQAKKPTGKHPDSACVQHAQRWMQHQPYIFSCKHTWTDAHTVGKSTWRQKAQTWHSKLRYKLFTYAVTILEICIKKRKVWSSLIEHAEGGIMHLLKRRRETNWRKNTGELWVRRGRKLTFVKIWSGKRQLSGRRGQGNRAIKQSISEWEIVPIMSEIKRPTQLKG